MGLHTSPVESSPAQSDMQRRGRHNLAYVSRPREYAPTQSSQVQSSPVKSDSPRRGICLTYTGCAPECVHIEESCPVDSIDATCFIFVSTITRIRCDGCYFAFENGCSKAILLVQVHQKICDASHCDQRKRPTVIDGRIAQSSF
jgi:hypothetical protein